MSQTTGQVCLGLLTAGENKWDASQSIEHIIHAIIAILIRPEVSTAMDHSTLNNYHHFRGTYEAKARDSAKAAAK